MPLKLSEFLSSSYAGKKKKLNPLSRGGLTILNKGTMQWSSSVCETAAEGTLKTAFDLFLNQVLGSESQSRDEEKPER